MTSKESVHSVAEVEEGCTFACPIFPVRLNSSGKPMSFLDAMTSTLTPSFKVSQTFSKVQISVDLPSSCPSSCVLRVVVDGGNVFGLACPHIHLPLVFPPGTLRDGSSQMSHSGDKSKLTVKRVGTQAFVDLDKVKVGDQIENLDRLKPSIFPPSGLGGTDEEDDDDDEEEEERLMGLEILQRGIDAVRSNGEGRDMHSQNDTLPHLSVIDANIKTQMHEQTHVSKHNISQHEKEELRRLACKAEEAKWDEGMYLDSFIDEGKEIQYLVCAKLQDSTRLADHSEHQPPLATKISQDEVKEMHLLLLEILLAYAYDHRTTLGEPTVETPWTISKLCRSMVASSFPSISLNDCATSVLTGSFRRQLTYPLYRNWALSSKVAQDVIHGSALQRPDAAVNVLREIQAQFETSEDEAAQSYSKDILLPLIHWLPDVTT